MEVTDTVRGFYEDYRRENRDGERRRDPPAMTRGGAGAAVLSFFRKLFAAALYIAVTAMSSVGLTTILNKPLRDMLFELARKTFFGS
jgi:hypothetical protein